MVPQQVDVSGDFLRFHYSASDLTLTAVPDALLERFLLLRTDDAIVKFARRYGPLQAPRRLDRRSGDHRLHGTEPHPSERISEWRRYQQLFSRLLGVAANLRDGRRVSSDALTHIADIVNANALPAEVVERWERLGDREARDAAAAVLLSWTQTFVRWSGLVPALVFDWSDSRSRFDLVFQDSVANRSWGGMALFGALVIQLLSAIAGTGFAVCSACGAAYVPSRRPRQNQRHYCSDCGRSAALRDAKAAYRARLRGESPIGGRSK